MTVTRYGEPSTVYTEQGATFSECEIYRYALWRTWDTNLPILVWGLLNPAKATQDQTDATNTRGEVRARALGFGTNVFLNAFGVRTPSPKVMKAHPNPVGPENDAVIMEWLTKADMFIAGWGTHGTHLGRDVEMRKLIADAGVTMHALKITKNGHPGHPLYLPYDLKPFPFNQPQAA